MKRSNDRRLMAGVALAGVLALRSHREQRDDVGVNPVGRGVCRSLAPHAPSWRGMGR